MCVCVDPINWSFVFHIARRGLRSQNNLFVVAGSCQNQITHVFSVFALAI